MKGMIQGYSGRELDVGNDSGTQASGVGCRDCYRETEVGSRILGMI